ncbi:meiosis inhibitor protein 1 isoform X3 [Oryzias melastigma]|uniref:meiosis inhibitor protein 1 isoform X3 n=1 Tax=Oryzias melastigma TaxID=30732 RepID=UPI000CF82342|nr:meiosis inhibitor protein 1 isoform X3 [Oryzias melastigma]
MTTLQGGDVVLENVHFRHCSKWSAQLQLSDGTELLFCVACAVEMMEAEDISSVRKSFALSTVSGILKSSPGALRELLLQDHRVALHLIATLLGMLQTVENPITLEKTDQVLVQLLSEFRNDLSFHFVLDEIQKQVNTGLSVKRSLPTFSFLGNLVKAVPEVAHSLVTQYVPLLDHLCSALLHPDEALKTSLVYVWLQLLEAPGGTAAQFLSTATRERLCVLLLQTFDSAGSEKLIRNCAGLLWQLVKQSAAVSLLMNGPGAPFLCHENQDSLANNSQILTPNQEQQLADHCPLPLLLKKLLLSGDEILQEISAKCIAAILVHSPSQYSSFFIKANLPGFLFERLSSGSSEMLLWSIYSCLVLLTEDQLFFSQCHSVYGIESLVRSLKQSLLLTNLEVPQQGFLLLTEILERQPPGLHLFPSGSGFAVVAEVVSAGVSSPSLQVATQAVCAAAALFRLNHQSRPVQYKELEMLVKGITDRFPELLLCPQGHQRNTGNLGKSDLRSKTSKSTGFLLQAMICFQAACRLAEECASQPALMENPFTAPHKHSDAPDSVQSLCRCLLHLCDSVWIPTTLRMCEFSPNAEILQYLYSILSFQFSLFPTLKAVFAKKLASSGFIRLSVEHKSLLCAGNRNPDLNASCCGFLQTLSMTLISLSDPRFDCYHDFEEVENLLARNLPSLCCHPSDWPSLFCEYQESRSGQYCLVMVLYLALQEGDRLLPDQTVFSSVLWLLQSVQEQGGLMPRLVLRSALYLLAVTQDKSPTLDRVALNNISKALSSQSFRSLYFHHPALLHFICGYNQLAEKFGALVLGLWLTEQTHHTEEEQGSVVMQKKGEDQEQPEEGRRVQHPDTETKELLALVQKFPNVTLILLDMVSSREAPLLERALGVLEFILQHRQERTAELCLKLGPALLQALQQISVESMSQGQGSNAQAVSSLPVLLKLLCATLTADPPSPPLYANMEEIHFKLLYHAVSMLLSNGGLMDQLQAVISSAPTLPPSACPPLALQCSGHLLLSSLITLQRAHSAQVCKSISWSLDTAVHRLLLQKRNTESLLLVSCLRLLQALLDADLTSPVVLLDSGPGLVGSQPLEIEDGALYPLGFKGAMGLLNALSAFILQKHEVLLRASINCLRSLLGFLKRKNLTTAMYAVCHPWTRFLLHCLLSSGESCFLHPAILLLITLLLQHNSSAVLWEPDLRHVIESVEKKGVKELSWEAAQTLSLLLKQIQMTALPTTEECRLRVARMIETLELQTTDEICDLTPPSGIVYPSLKSKQPNPLTPQSTQINQHILPKMCTHSHKRLLVRACSFSTGDDICQKGQY